LARRMHVAHRARPMRPQNVKDLQLSLGGKLHRIAGLNSSPHHAATLVRQSSYVNDYFRTFLSHWTHSNGREPHPPFHVTPRSGLKAHTSPPSQNPTHHLPLTPASRRPVACGRSSRGGMRAARTSLRSPS